jgi:hypothetical protein
MEKKDTKTVLLDTRNSEYLYEDYVDYCESNGLEVHEPFSQDYWDWVAMEIEADYDCRMSCIDSNVDANDVFAITGCLGLWDGKKTICPVMVESMAEGYRVNGEYKRTYRSGLRLAIDKCLNDIEYYTVEYDSERGCVEVTASHHDGTNCFEIWKLSEFGRNAMADADAEYEDYEVTQEWFGRIEESDLF